MTVLPTLRKLHIVGVPETVSLATLEIAARGVFAPGLRTLGVLQISFHDVSRRLLCSVRLIN